MSELENFELKLEIFILKSNLEIRQIIEELKTYTNYNEYRTKVISLVIYVVVLILCTWILNNSRRLYSEYNKTNSRNLISNGKIEKLIENQN
jgi:hypothetical protein